MEISAALWALKLGRTSHFFIGQQMFYSVTLIAQLLIFVQSILQKGITDVISL